ncbi:MAG: dihydroorotase family protein, partial [Chloroflexota bacterium]
SKPKTNYWVCGVVTPRGTVEGDVAIAGERILAVTSGEAAPNARETLDVRGMVVLPGAIDTHTHHREPGFTLKEDITTATMAAAAGGVTTSVGMPNVEPPTNTVERYRAVLELYRVKSLVDYNHNPAPTVLDQIPGLAREGALAFKVWMLADTKRTYPHMPGIAVHDHGHLLEIAEAVAPTGRPLMVHPHDQELMRVIEERSWARGETDHRAYARAFASYEGMVWDGAVAWLLRLQAATSVRLHVLHVKTRRLAELVRAAKARGQRVSAELNPIAVFAAHDWANVERLGPYVLSTWTGPDQAEHLWRALADGTIDVIGTDHAPHTKEEKEIGWVDMWKAAGGAPAIQEYLSLFLTAVGEGRLTLERLVDLTSTGPARIFGLYPRKGVIREGSDADLVVVDPTRERVIRNEDVLSKCGWSAFEGMRVRGVPVHTLVRGAFVYRDGRVVGRPGHGKLAVPVAAEVPA